MGLGPALTSEGSWWTMDQQCVSDFQMMMMTKVTYRLTSCTS
jgi:hypothetical protein